MEGQNNGDGPSQQRWTCEACGCNTNPGSDRTCSICGTSNAGPSLLRRAGYAARSGLFARSIAARRAMNDEMGIEGDELWERVVDDVDMGGDDENSIAALAMEVAGVSGGVGGRDFNRQRFMDAARSFAMATRETHRPNPEELLQAANENGSLYQPKWINPSQIGGRMRTGNGIEVGEGENQNVAHLPLGAGEGRALRALESFPRSAPFASFHLSSPSNSGSDRRPRRAFGFRVAFEHPNKAAGASMGGCYLVGVTTTSFAAFGERNGLQQSPFFWGIEDSGNKYEGSRNSHASRGGRRGQSTFAIEVGASEAPRNVENSLFGSREVVTCVVDFESRTLTFWRDEELIGTIVANLPRGGNLYPVVVPFNPGATVAITGMGGNPLPLLGSFAKGWKQAQLEKDVQRRSKLIAQRSVLLLNGAPTPEVIAVLRKIFLCYASTHVPAPDELCLSRVEASRLWYRCGLKLSCLHAIIEKKTLSMRNKVTFEDLLNLVNQVIQEEDKKSANHSASETSCEVGDKVELVEGYERYGDASNGPLQPGDRGTVVERQKGPNGERPSVRVIYSGRRWWYQPQALLPEKSGLTESPGVWFLRTILRAHGYDHTTLEVLYGKPVTNLSWQVGDIVTPKKSITPGSDLDSQPERKSSIMDSCVGRIVAETSSSASSLTARGRDSGTVLVEFIGKAFGEAVGIQVGSGIQHSQPGLETRRVRVSRLVHSSVFHGDPTEDKKDSSSSTPMVWERNISQREDRTAETENKAGSEVGVDSEFTVDEKLASNMRKVRRLDLSAIESVTKECKKNSAALASVFAAGLPDAVIAAVDCAEKKLLRSEDGEGLSQAISAIGRLAAVVVEQLVPKNENEISEQQRDQAVQREGSVEGVSRQPPHPNDNGEADDSAQANARLSVRNDRREPRSFRISDSALMQEMGRAGRMSSLQQRRSMLLALMSRSRRSNSGSLGDFLHRESNGPNRDISLGNAMPPLGPFRQDAVEALHFGGDLSSGGSWDSHAPDDEDRLRLPDSSSPSPGNRSRSGGRAGSESAARPGMDEPLLESILRGRGDEVAAHAGKAPGPLQYASLRALISNGLMGNSLDWVKAALDSQGKRVSSKSPGRGALSLHSAADEEGTTLLLLAISLGCSIEILKYLIKLGAQVCEKEIMEAARSNQPQSLAALLQGAVYPDGFVDLNECSPAVAAVIRGASERQSARERKMRLEVGSVMASLLRKLLRLGLIARHQQNETDLCSRAIAGTLVGNVLLRALHKRQEHAGSSAQDSRGSRDSDPSHDEGDVLSRSRITIDGSYAPLSSTPQGLLSSLPEAVVGESLFEDMPHVTTFLLLVEDYLCSKDINDGAIGLTLLSSVLKRFPFFSSSTEIERYGYSELVSSHDAFASNRLAEISARVATRASANATDESSEAEALATSGVVLCPKQHAASLHVTRHSSFRCDLCGKGVERGRAMHGCRECDWDACERCTDVAEGGIVKWNYIRELASECQSLLTTDSEEENNAFAEKILESSLALDNRPEINNLSIRLLQRDGDAIKELSSLLKARGGLTFHQFLTVILPALHASLMGRSAENCRVNVSQTGFSRRTKKPRVIGSSSRDMEESFHSHPSDDRFSFCKDIIKYLIKDDRDKGLQQDKHWLSDMADVKAEKLPRESSDDEDEGSDDGLQEDIENTGRDAESVDFGSARIPELLRRLHQVLSLYESVTLLHHAHRRSASSGTNGGDLQSLTKPLEIRLFPLVSKKRPNAGHLGKYSMSLHAEPLMAVADLQRHVLRTCTMTHSTYVSFCRRLAGDKAIIVEQPSPAKLDGAKQIDRRVARVVGFDEETGFHSVQYAVELKGRRGHGVETLELVGNEASIADRLRFDEKVTRLMLAAREYYVLCRDKRTTDADCKSPFDMEHLLTDGIVAETEDDIPGSSTGASIGTRVESNCGSEEWQSHTIVAVDTSETGSGKDDVRFVLVSDSGVVHCGVESTKIRGLDRNEGYADDSTQERSGRSFSNGRAGEGRGHISRTFPFLTVRRQTSDTSRSPSTGSAKATPGVGVLKRTWSALSPIESMCPVEVNLSEESTSSFENGGPSGGYVWRFSLGDGEVEIYAGHAAVELPPRLRVKFSSQETLTSLEIAAPEETTLISLLWRLYQRDEQRLVGDRPHDIFYSVACEVSRLPEKNEPFIATPTLNVDNRAVWSKLFLDGESSGMLAAQASAPNDLGCPNSLLSMEDAEKNESWTSPASRSRKLRQITTYLSEDEGEYRGLCGGLDEICVQCMEIIGLLSEGAEVGPEPKDKTSSGLSVFETVGLSKKLLEQLDDPLMVVGGALPEWCTIAPSFAPRVFSYGSRRLLLERVAFGASRSTLKQQESKVNVGRLRQRMASLRARAVELVGEAFSGGAEDPTALQLQADELYGMEEALAARVKAAFRAERWEEKSLQVAKAAVHRDLLISDAAAIMHRYANDDRICRRRLEVRFDGESGFDAASGDEAGVTRGFYADVAEALLSCEIVAGVSLTPLCPNTSTASLGIIASLPAHGIPCKIPLWIPDVDASGHVVIPTPRADPRSALGVYPRPLSNRHPQMGEVLVQFRFMGRLFASSIRDGFMFPLPLSSAFLKLVQHGTELTSHSGSWGGLWASSSSNHSSTSVMNSSGEGIEETGTSRGMDRGMLLSTYDLPRPGFLGGEVYATDKHICRALDRFDEMDPPMARSELESRYNEIATDKNFARVALGKTFDCSFEDYFQDRTFVDPLDPTQGLDAYPLCPNGHQKAVTIYNVREWVALVKDYILHDGVIAQALAFRRGVEDFFPADYLRLFTPEELQRDVCGVGDNVDNWEEGDVRKLFKLDGGKGAAEALVAVAAIGGEGGAALSRRFGPSSPTIGFVVKALLEATPKMRRQFLSFVTSVPIVTPGQIEVVPVVSPSGEFMPMRDPGCLPRANTCARRLYLPKFETYEVFSQVLWAVVGEESKFKGFYEWRGS